MGCIIEDDWILMLTRWKRNITRDKAKEGIIFNLGGLNQKEKRSYSRKLQRNIEGKDKARF